MRRKSIPRLTSVLISFSVRGRSKVVWDGYYLALYAHLDHSHVDSTYGRFSLRVTDLGGTPLALTAASTIAGVDNSLGAVLDVQGAFKANWQFESEGRNVSGSLIPLGPALTVFDQSATVGDQLFTSVGGGFYSTAPTTDPVPEPASIMLVLAGAGGALVRRRKRQSQS